MVGEKADGRPGVGESVEIGAAVEHLEHSKQRARDPIASATSSKRRRASRPRLRIAKNMATPGSSESNARQVSSGIREIGLHDIGAWAVARISATKSRPGKAFHNSGGSGISWRHGRAMTPTTRASAEGKLFKKGIARGSAKASSGKDMSSGMASEIRPGLWRPRTRATPRVRCRKTKIPDLSC